MGQRVEPLETPTSFALADRPRLRPIEVVPFQDRGRRGFVLRDPSDPTIDQLMVSEGAADVLALLASGGRTLQELSSALVLRGVAITRRGSRDFLTRLDETGFLEGRRANSTGSSSGGLNFWLSPSARLYTPAPTRPTRETWRACWPARLRARRRAGFGARRSRARTACPCGRRSRRTSTCTAARRRTAGPTRRSRRRRAGRAVRRARHLPYRRAGSVRRDPQGLRDATRHRAGRCRLHRSSSAACGVTTCSRVSSRTGEHSIEFRPSTCARSAWRARMSRR